MANKTKSNLGIKQGDKVMVSKDAPKVYLSSVNNLFKYHVCKVEEVDGDSAIIRCTDIGIDRWLAIPCKYLVKVDAEAKEAKIKLGDMVRVKGNLHEPFCLDADLHLEITNIPPHAVSQKEWKVIKVENRRDCAEHIYTLNNGDSFIYNIPEDCMVLIEPTEQTESHTDANEKLQEEYMRFMKDCMSGEIYTQSDFLKDCDPAKHEVNPKPRCIPKIMFNTEFWVKYEAELAKELSVVYAKQGIDPIEAVGKAKEIIKQLKQNK